MRRLLRLGLILLVGVSCVFASAKTLPAGVLKTDLNWKSYGIEKGGVNPSGDHENWLRKDLSKFQMKDVQKLTGLKYSIDQARTVLNNAGLPETFTVDLDTYITSSWKRNHVGLDFAYGLTDRLTFFVNFLYESAVLDYTDEYTSQSQNIERVLTLAKQGDAYTQAPEQAESNHMKDVYMGFKYGFTDQFAVAVKASAGFLRIGTDAREKTYKDGEQELETGKTYDEYQFFGFYDTSVMSFPLHLMAGYILKGEGYQNFLDNDFDARFGNVVVVGAGTEWKLLENLILNAKLNYLIADKDEYYDTTTSAWIELKNSAATTLMGEVGAEYHFAKFLRAFVNVGGPISNHYKGQLYDFPGRLEPGMSVKFGVTLFYR